MGTSMLPEPSRIMLAGDWHGNTLWAIQCIRHAHEQGCDVIVHLGDFGWWIDCIDTHKFLRHVQKTLTECGITLYWVDGNHEFHPGIDEWVDATGGSPWSDKRYPNIVHLPRGFRWEWWGQTWLALGGAHSVDRHLRTEGRSWWSREHISEDEIARAISGGGVDVMVTHDCPTGVAIPGILDDPQLDSLNSGWPVDQLRAAVAHRKKLRRVCDEVRPQFLFHGHYHRRYVGVLRYPDGTTTKVVGLAEDATGLQVNTMLLHRRDG